MSMYCGSAQVVLEVGLLDCRRCPSTLIIERLNKWDLKCIRRRHIHRDFFVSFKIYLILS